METGNMIILMMTLKLFKDLLRFVVWCIIKVNKKKNKKTTKIPQCRNNSNIKYQNRRKRQNRYS